MLIIEIFKTNCFVLCRRSNQDSGKMDEPLQPLIRLCPIVHWRLLENGELSLWHFPKQLHRRENAIGDRDS